MIEDHNPLFLQWKAPNGFPSRNKCKNGYHDSLLYAVGHTHTKIMAGIWSKVEAELFLNYGGLNGKAQKGII